MIIISAGLFSLSLCYGFIYKFFNKGKLSYSSVDLHLVNFSKSQIFKIVLHNNVLAMLLLIAPTFGYYSVLNLLYNGFSSGIIIGSSSRVLPPVTVLLLILPHGIFEIPAIIIAGAAGFKIPYEIVRYLAGKKEQPKQRKT